MVTLDTAPPPPPPASQRPSTVALAQPDAAPQKAQAPAKPAAETALSFADAPPLTQAPLPTQDPAPAPQPVASGPVVNVPLPRLRPPHTVVASLSPPSRPARSVRPTIAPTRVAAVQSGFADGTFTGPSVYAYYGRVQVQAIIQNGRLVAIKMLDYPSDRRTSLYINRQALPMLRDEVIQAQSANVDMISGATLTSQGFIRSLAGALRKATRA
jgi:uncharacterized protein with FMN-binding domain